MLKKKSLSLLSPNREEEERLRPTSKYSRKKGLRGSFYQCVATSPRLKEFRRSFNFLLESLNYSRFLKHNARYKGYPLYLPPKHLEYPNDTKVYLRRQKDGATCA
jgi:hypothetical protein